MTSESLIFDGNRVQEEQEEQLKQEEDERQQQLKDLLANAFDDLEADDTCSVASDESHDSGRHSDEIGQQQAWNVNKPSYHASTPVSDSKAPPLVTPVIQKKYSSSYQHQLTYQTSPYGANQRVHEEQQQQQTLFQEAETTATQSYNTANLSQQSDQQSYLNNYVHYQSISSHSRGSNNTEQQHNSRAPLHSLNPHSDAPARQDTGINGELDNTTYADRPIQMNEAMANHQLQQANHQLQQTNHQLQQQFFQEGPKSAHTQLEILYHAKSRQLQDLQEKYELHQLENAKEIRILRHEAALLEGAKQGAEASLRQSQTLLTENKEARFQLQKRVEQLEFEQQNLASERAELKQQLEAAEGSMESLNAQILELGSTDTVERLREQHEAITSRLTQLHESEVRDLRAQLNFMREEMDNQSQGIENSKQQLRADMESIAKERLDHADIVNRLTKSLKESQRQTEELLNQASGAELGKIRIELQQANASRTLTEQLCDSLQREVSDLQQQLSLSSGYQLIADLTEQARYSGNQMDVDDTMVELGIKPLQNEKCTRDVSQKCKEDDTVLILRQELQKCLLAIKEKRSELSTLRTKYNKSTELCHTYESNCQVLQGNLDKMQCQLKEANIELNLYKSAAESCSSLAEIKLKRQVDSLMKDKSLLEEEIKTLTQQFETATANEAKLEEINAELNSKITEMVDDFDQDKKAALDRCQETLENHSKTVREMMKSELESEFSIKIHRLESQYEDEVAKLRSSSASLNQELNQVKELYVQVCQDKTKLEEEEKLNAESHTTQLQDMLDDIDKLKRSSAEQEQQLKQKILHLEEERATLEADQISLQEKIVSLQVQIASNKRQIDGDERRDSLIMQHINGSSPTLTDLDNLPANSRPCDRGTVTSYDCLTPGLSEHESNLKKTELVSSQSSDLAKSGCKIACDEKSEIVLLQSDLSERHSLLSQQSGQIAQLNAEIKQLNTVISDLHSDNQKLDALLSSERTQLNIARRSVAGLESQIKEYQSNQDKYDSIMAEIGKTQIDLTNTREHCVKLEAELAAEKTSHKETKNELYELETGLTAEQTSQTVARNSLEVIEHDYQLEKSSHKSTKEELAKIEAELDAERRNHGHTKIQLAKTEAGLATEQANVKELRLDLEKVKGNHRKADVELEVSRSNEKRNVQLIGDLRSQQSRDKQQLEGLKASNKQLLADLNEAKTETIRKVSEASQLKITNNRLMEELELLVSDHQKERSQLIDQHNAAMEAAMENVKRSMEQDTSAVQHADIFMENQKLSDKLNLLEAEAHNYEKLLSEADQHFEEQLNKVRKQIEKEHQEKINSIMASLDEKEKQLKAERTESEKRGEQLKQQAEALSHQVKDLESKCEEYHGCTEHLRASLQSLTSQVSDLKSTNKKLQLDLTSSRAFYEGQINDISSELQAKSQGMVSMEHEHSIMIQSLKQKMIAMRNEHNTEVETIKSKLPKQGMVEETAHIQYENALQKIRVEVLSYVEQTNKDAAKLIKSEIHKARQATARQLRNYYVRCFKQSLADDMSSSEQKLMKLEKTLDKAVAALTALSPDDTDTILTLPTRLAENLSNPSSQLRHTATGGKHEPKNVCRPGNIADNYKYVPLRQSVGFANSGSPGNTSKKNTQVHPNESRAIIRELGLNNMETSPPRRYNPPPEKLVPSPRRNTDQSPSQTNTKSSL